MGREMRHLPSQGGKKAEAKRTPEQKKKKKKKKMKQKMKQKKKKEKGTSSPAPPATGTSRRSVASRNREIQERAGVTAAQAAWAGRLANDEALRAAPAPEAPAFSARSAGARALILAAASAAGGGGGGGGGGPAARPPSAAASYLKVIRNDNEAKHSGTGRFPFDASGLRLFAPFLPEAVRGGGLKGDELAEALRAAGAGNGTGDGGPKLLEFPVTFHVQTPGEGGRGRGGGAAADDAPVEAVTAVVTVARDGLTLLFRIVGTRWGDLLRTSAGNWSAEAREQLLGTILLFERFGGGSGSGGRRKREGPFSSSSSQQQQQQQPLILVTAVAHVRLPSKEEAIEMWKRRGLQGVGGGGSSRRGGSGSDGGGGGATEDDDEENGSSEDVDDTESERSDSSSGGSSSGSEGSGSDSSDEEEEDAEEEEEEEEGVELSRRPLGHRYSRPISPPPPEAFSSARLRSPRVQAIIDRSRTGRGEAPSAACVFHMKTLRANGRFLSQLHKPSQRAVAHLFAPLLPLEVTRGSGVSLMGAPLRAALKKEGRRPGGGSRKARYGQRAWLWSRRFDVVVDRPPPAAAAAARDVSCTLFLLDVSQTHFYIEGATALLEAAGVTEQGSRVLFERYDTREGGGGGGSGSRGGGGGGGGAASSTFVFSNLGVAAAGSSEGGHEDSSDEDEDDERGGGGRGGRGGGRGTPAALEQSARAGGKRQRLREGGEAAGATAAAAGAAATPADTESPKKPRPFPPPLPGFHGDGSGGGGRRALGATAAATADGIVPPRSRGLALVSLSVSVPILTSLDCEFIQLSDEGARLFDAAADGALGGAPEKAGRFSFRQRVFVAPSASPAAAPRASRPFEKIKVEVDRIPNTSATRAREGSGGGGGGGGNGGEAGDPARAEEEEPPPAFLTLGGCGWRRVSELLGLAPGAAVRFERDPQTGFVHASRAAGWV